RSRSRRAPGRSTLAPPRPCPSAWSLAPAASDAVSGAAASREATGPLLHRCAVGYGAPAGGSGVDAGAVVGLAECADDRVAAAVGEVEESADGHPRAEARPGGSAEGDRGARAGRGAEGGGDRAEWHLEGAFEIGALEAQVDDGEIDEEEGEERADARRVGELSQRDEGRSHRHQTADDEGPGQGSAGASGHEAEDLRHHAVAR